MIVYLIVNNYNCKYYIGKTTKSLGERWKEHLDAARRDFKDYLYKAIRKYGKEYFTVTILCEVRTEEELSDAERLWILALRSYDHNYGYNMTYGGEGGRLSDEFKRRISNSLKGHKGAWAGKKLEDIVGKDRAEELKKQISLRMLGNNINRLRKHCGSRAGERKGKTHAQIFGEEKAKEIREKRIATAAKKKLVAPISIYV